LGGGPCVAVATDDGLEVKLGHFGDARYYFHYKPGPRGWELVRVVENPWRGGHHGGGEEGKRGRIYEANSECSVIVATALGPGGREYMESRGLRVVIVKPRTSVREALEAAARALAARA